MIAAIMITRRDERGEDRPFLVDLTRDRDGDIWSACGEDVDELRTTSRHGSIETHPTGRLFQRRGDPIELTDEELIEAEASLTQLESLWAAERTRLREIFRPFDDVAAHTEDQTASGVTSPIGSPLPSEFRIPSSEFPLPRHDLLNSQGIDITLPPGLDALYSDLPLPASDLERPPSVNPPIGLPSTSDFRLSTSDFERPPAASVANSPNGEEPTPGASPPAGSFPHSAFRFPSSALAKLPATPLPKENAAHG